MTGMDSPFSRPIRIHYRPPRGLMIFLSLIHAGALAIIIPLHGPAWLRVFLALIIMGSYIIYCLWLMHARRGRLELIMKTDNQWQLLDHNSQHPSLCEIKLVPGAFVHPWLVALKFRGPERAYTFLLTRENVAGDSLRRLRVRLLHPG